MSNVGYAYGKAFGPKRTEDSMNTSPTNEQIRRKIAEYEQVDGRNSTLAEARPMTRLEAAHDTQFRALVRLRDLHTRALAIARHLVGDVPPAPPDPHAELKISRSGMAGACNQANSSLPLVRRVEETGEFLNEAIDDISEALDRIGTV